MSSSDILALIGLDSGRGVQRVNNICRTKLNLHPLSLSLSLSFSISGIYMILLNVYNDIILYVYSVYL